MGETSAQWLKTCGVGCGVFLAVLIGIGIVAGLYIKDQFQGVIDAGESQESLVETLGEIDDYTPRHDGSIAPDRMEVFLEIRRSLHSQQVQIDSLIADFPPDEILQEDSSSLSKVVSVIREAAGLIDPLAGYVETRNRALLHSGMALGEYLYIYSVSYFSWLGHSPEDGPLITKGKGPEDPPERLLGARDSDWGPDRTRIRYRRYAIAFLQNQLQQVESLTQQEPELETRLREELRRLERSPEGVLWGLDLPEALKASLVPYRRALEETYHPATNCFEFPRNPAKHR